MATHDWPESLTPQTVSWGIRKSAVHARSPLAGSVQSTEFPGHFWSISVTLPQWALREGGEAEAFFARVSGGAERVRVPYWLRPAPRGTMRGSPTVSAQAVRGALTLSISTTGTLAAGDFFSIGAQMFQVFQACAPSGGILSVPLVNRVRTTISSGAAVVWDRPTVDCVIPSMMSTATYQRGVLDGMPIDLEEAPAF